jgi:chromosomal replication initiator protein
MSIAATLDCWTQFLDYARKQMTLAAFKNWLEPVEAVSISEEQVTLAVPNIFVKEYLLDNLREELCAFLPMRGPKEPAIEFIIRPKAFEAPATAPTPPAQPLESTAETAPFYEVKLNPSYRFETYIEGASNQFAKSAAIGVASRPGKTYNPSSSTAV